jgi:hypothetical protein
MDQQSVVCLGRFGDICNALPIAWDISRSRSGGEGEKPKFFVSSEFASILEGISYVQPMVWNVDYKEVKKAIARIPNAIVCQAYKNPDQRRLTDSYQKESWRVAGWLDKFGTIPLVFDRRNKEREDALAEKYRVDECSILVAGSGVSSPFKMDLWKEMQGVEGIVNLSAVRAEKIFDIIGLIERARLLLTIDSSPLHFSRVTKTKVVALVNDGYFGSVPPAHGVAIRYADATPEVIADAIQKCLATE